MSYAKRAAPVLVLAAVLLFWEAAVRLFQIPLYVLPSPGEVLKALAAERGTLWNHSVFTPYADHSSTDQDHFSGTGHLQSGAHRTAQPSF